MTNSKFIKCIIQSSDTLRVLNLSDCYLELRLFQDIVRLCQELRELKISGDCCYLSEGAVNFLCKNLTTKIEKLDICGQPNFGDKHLKVLVERCNKLTEFKFDSQFDKVTDKSVDVIVENLSNTLTKVSAYWVKSFDKLKKLAAMPHLMVLEEPDIEDDTSDQEPEEWKYQIPQIREVMPCFPETYNEFIDIQIKIAEPYSFFDDRGRYFTINFKTMLTDN